MDEIWYATGSLNIAVHYHMLMALCVRHVVTESLVFEDQFSVRNLPRNAITGDSNIRVDT
jgi:hypothetical protein